MKQIAAASAAQAPLVPTGDIISKLMQATTDPALDVNKLASMGALVIQFEALRAEREFNIALLACKSDMPNITKDRVNPQTNSRYASYDHISDLVDPVTRQHGFTLSFGTAESPLADHYRMTVRLRHVGGHHEDYIADIPIDAAGIAGKRNKTPTHAFGSTISYGRRYLKCMVFDISFSEDDDGNAAGEAVSAGPVTTTQADKLKEFAAQVSADEKAFLAWATKAFKADIADWTDIPADCFDAAMAALEAKAKQNTKKAKEAA